MQFIDLKAQQRRIRDCIFENINHVLDHGQYLGGPEIEGLENKLANFVGVKYAAAVASGTDALLISLMALQVRPGDAVFVPVFTFIATAEVVGLLDAVPIFVDIDPQTFNIDPQKLEDAIKRVVRSGKLRARGIIPVDLFGQAAEYDDIVAIARKYNLFILEDAAQSFGGIYKGRKTCALAEIGATSFFPAKPLGAYGDGGMIFTDDKSLHEVFFSIRVHGQGENKYANVRLGMTGRLDSIQAAVLLAKFSIFPDELKQRQVVADHYSSLLRDLVTVPFIRKGNLSSWAQYSVLHPQRDEIINYLRLHGVPTAIYYPIPLHQQRVFADFKQSTDTFPVAEKISQQIFSLPMHPYLEFAEQEMIAAIIRKSLQ